MTGVLGIVLLLAQGAETAPTEAEPIEIKAGKIGFLPKAVYQPQPGYPAMARQASLEGVVVLEIVVNHDGAVERLTVLEGAPIFVTSAEAAVRRWRYEPLIIDGSPRYWKSKVNLHFRLQHPTGSRVYGQALTLELGGSLAAANRWLGSAQGSGTGTNFDLQPFVGFFVRDRLEITFDASLRRSLLESNPARGIGLDAGFAYLFETSDATRLGPFVGVGVFSWLSPGDVDNQPERFREDGQRLGAGASGRMFIGGVAMLSASAGLSYERFGYQRGFGSSAVTGRGDRLGFVGSLGLTFYVPR